MIEGANYTGVKYEAKRVELISIPSRKLTKQLIIWGGIFHELKLAPPYEGGSFGNIGFRDKDGSIRVTPSNKSIADLTAKEIMTITNVEERNGKPPIVYFYGHPKRKPTSEAQIYWELFKALPKTNVILHGHDAPVMANAHKLGKLYLEVAVTSKFQAYGTPEFTKEILIALKKDTLYLVARDHGIFSFGETFHEAGTRALKFHILSQENIG